MITEKIKQNLKESKELILEYEKKNANHHRLNIVLEQALQAINRIEADEILNAKNGKEYFEGHPTPETEIKTIFAEEEKPKKTIKKPRIKKNDRAEDSWTKV